jgi:glycosyltransferase involved in cell wall biosynthesis
MANDYILEVSWGCPSDKWPINGLFQFDQAKAISDSGKRVVFLALDLRSIRRWRKWGLNKFNKNGIDVYKYNFPLGGFKPSIKYAVQDYAFRRSIKTIVKELGHPSCVHIHCCQQAISASDYCLANNISYIITEHITPLNEGEAIEKRKKETLEHAKQLICVSNALAKDMKNTYGVDSVVIPNIVDFTEFKYTPKQKTDIFRFLSDASVNYGKGFEVLVKAYAKFLEEAKDLSKSGHKDTHLTIMGDGPEFNNKKELAKNDCFVLARSLETF